MHAPLTPSFGRIALFITGALGLLILLAAPPPAAAQGTTGTSVCSVKLLGNILGTTGSTLGPVTSAGGGGLPVYDVGANLKLGFIAGQQFNQTAIQSNNTQTDFASCVVRSISRALIQQMTVSIVNWINSGFNGEPSFVRNYEQFFTQVADNAVGNFLQGSDLAFLCSPFKTQVKIAIAQSYAKRTAPQCSLLKVVNNIDSFVNSFSQGGWQGLLSFTTVPTNNPYGAYSDAQSRLLNTVSQNQATRGLDLSLGRGFLSFREETNCIIVGTPPSASLNKSVTPVGVNNGAQQYKVCDVVNSTPGSTIANQLDTTLGTNFRQLELAQSFDQILSALVNQLMVRTLQGGLSNLSSSQGFGGNPNDLAGSASSFTEGLGQNIAAAQQIRSILGENLADIEAAQLTVDELYDCWIGHVGTSTLTAEQRAQAAQNASSTLAVYQNLERSRTQYTEGKTRLDAAVARLEEYQARALSTRTLEELQRVVQEYSANLNSFPNSNAVLQAQQNRVELTADLSTLRSNTATKLDEGDAFPPTT